MQSLRTVCRYLPLLQCSLWLAMAACLGCSPSTQNSPGQTGLATYTLSVASAVAPSVPISVFPSDNSGLSNGTTSFTRSYNVGSTITLTAPASSGTYTFASWTGCATASSTACTVILSANTSVTANYNAPNVYMLTVKSAAPAGGVGIAASPADNSGSTGGNTSFSLSYNAGTTVSLTAPASTGSYTFVSWSGCTSSSSNICSVGLTANTTVQATYNAPTVLSVTPMPTASVTIGTRQQYTATVTGTGAYSSAVTWSVATAGGSTLSPGTITGTGLYTTPYPAPASVIITATSTQDTTQSGSVAVALVAPPAATGPPLSVDAGTQTHAINPYIYGMNNYTLSSATASAANITLDRFGGDATSRYNYKLDVSSSASDYYFENFTAATGQQATGQFNKQVTSDTALGARTIGTVNVLGYVAKDGTSCSFPVSTYPSQSAVEPYRMCGSGQTPAKVNITGNDPTVTSTAVGPSFAGGWVTDLVSRFGTAANGGVPIYDLDNEPADWDSVHRDVHPVPFTYDEVTNNGMATAKAIKAADATAAVSGPVMDQWMNYFYSKKDSVSGWSSGPCYQQWDNPVDRNAHGGVPFIEYYLQQFAAYQAANNVRLLDYVDIHAYFTARYNGASLSFAPAGDTGAQQARLNSTRVLWDATYTDPAFTQPNYTTDANYITSCNLPALAPQLIPRLQGWVKNDYPGTGTAIDEYNWGGQESINGALAQADILGIFGSYGLDIGVLWGPPDATTQVPGLVAFEIFRNYDGNKSTFGNKSLASTSGNQGALSVYGALRTSDSTVTIVVINKTYGDLTSTLTLPNLTPNGPAKSYLYSNAHISGIVQQSNLTVTPPAGGSTTSSVAVTFPAQSITLLLVPKM